MEKSIFIEEAIKLGASKAIAISTADIVFNPRCRLKCIVPLCPNYRKNLMCPPFLPPFNEAKEMIQKYRWGILVIVETPVSQEKDKIETGSLKVYKIVSELEKAAFNKGYRFAAGFTSDSCKLCDKCVIAEKNDTTCRHPLQARPSMQAMGIDVTATLEKVVTSSLEFPPKEKIMWVGMVLIE